MTQDDLDHELLVQGYCDQSMLGVFPERRKCVVVHVINRNKLVTKIYYMYIYNDIIQTYHKQTKLNFI